MWAWRLTAARYAAEALSGAGAKRAGNRWNPRGVAVAYTTESRALAVLEMLVHVSPATVPEDLVLVPVDIPQQAGVEHLAVGNLPADWNLYPYTPATQTLGARWVREARSPVLAVPSAIVPDEFNYLINPSHPDFALIKAGPPVPFCFDPRLLRRGA